MNAIAEKTVDLSTMTNAQLQAEINECLDLIRFGFASGPCLDRAKDFASQCAKTLRRRQGLK